MSVVADYKSRDAHSVGKLPTDVTTSIVSHKGDVVRVGLVVGVPASHTVNSAGKISDKLPAYYRGFVFQMNYIGGRWLLYYVDEVS